MLQLVRVCLTMWPWFLGLEWVATLDDENIEKENFDENINEGRTTNIVENINDWGVIYVVYVSIDWNTNVVVLD